MGFRLFLRCKPLERKMENTEAESVDDIVAESNKAVKNPSPPDSIVIPKTNHTASPVKMAVKRTPTVASTTPCGRMGLISEILVSIPPEKSMMQSATEPMVCASWIFSKCIPTPSLPKTIPTAKNNKRAGTPNLCPAFPAKILRKKSTETVNKISSMLIPILNLSFLKEVKEIYFLYLRKYKHFPFCKPFYYLKPSSKSSK